MIGDIDGDVIGFKGVGDVTAIGDERIGHGHNVGENGGHMSGQGEVALEIGGDQLKRKISESTGAVINDR